MNELEAYNITIREQNQDAFFEGPLPPYSGPAGFVQHEDRVPGLDATSLALIKRLDLAGKVMEGEESAVDDFSLELLRALGYETERTVVRTRKTIRFLMCGQAVSSKTDVCLLDPDTEILLLVQEDKTHIHPSNPEPQLIAGAIGAFQENNRRRAMCYFLSRWRSRYSRESLWWGPFPDSTRSRSRPSWTTASDMVNILLYRPSCIAIRPVYRGE
ncbi:hypothetical protein A0H81_06152 [Grifola frondosa]|uniref:Uncharacterized protein n=1 Tax=Grifola frondosa TaxID=5627 RepID=A0A1C7M989_GRIFR|nr:hypothetical protein A0H81_06152 [Grifola frondosa]